MRIVSCCVLLGACGVEPEHSFSFEVSLHDTQDVVGVSVDDELAHLEHRPTGR